MFILLQNRNPCNNNNAVCLLIINDKEKEMKILVRQNKWLDCEDSEPILYDRTADWTSLS